MSLTKFAKRGIATAWDLKARITPSAPRLTILYYHAVAADLAGDFDAQMAFLRRCANIVQADHSGPLDPVKPNVAVTFDDAFRSVRENALPALIRHGVPATIFVPTGWLGRRPGWTMETSGDRDEEVMSADEIAGLPTDIITLGSHTVTHPHLSRLAPGDIDAQLQESRQSLEALLGRTIDTLAFPYGDHDSSVVQRAAAAGYRYVYTVEPQAISAGDRAISRGRTAADPSDSLGLFALKSRGAYAVMPYFYRLKRRLRGRSD
ncbi:polysaccharide deacetylase family protein [Phenylobacterium sp. SCN 70-31]|uniref:polysaccharide deacetylase family protein n=1 Tax=Phenylobacterium sp. SCN 70-31 TaxID=1660129 RepID=UPI0008691A15|nr:polysaccharide deacetylase family protein [Phenylobacterium sp. SCN 70-31]ODT87849.1 MAG: hypothetical protein ABS78_09705 [Phenylobacterium sp. SCN 70-31]